jgi:pimeloyl-ACP methyl ester carboxylesterase
MATFRHNGHRIAYTVRGPRDSGRTTILVHGLLLSQKMHLPLARALAARGNRVVTIDLLGHGASDRPQDMWRYSMSLFGEQVVALMDHLELEESVVLGTSLGANTALEIADRAPQRLRGMVVEMPVLDNALLGCAIAFLPLWLAATFGAPITRPTSQLVARLPRRGVPFWGEVMLDWIGQDPGASAAVLQGIFFGRTAPNRTERRKIDTPALVIGHRRDPIHPFSDAGMLVDELPNGRLIEADSIVELRLRPERLTTEIGDFIEDCWQPRRAHAQRRRASAGA